MTTRQFNLMGNASGTDVTAIVTINGVEVFNGTFSDDPSEPEIAIVRGSADVVDTIDGTDTVLPVSITITSGSALIGMFQWNYGMIPNPVYTPQQFAIATDPATTPADLLAVFVAVANPQFTQADMDVFASTDPADDAAKYELVYSHHALPYIQDSNILSGGITAEDNDCNRSNAILNGVPYTVQPLYFPIPMTTGDVLTFDTDIFSSDVLKVYPGSSGL